MTKQKETVRLTPRGCELLELLLPRMQRIQDRFCDAQVGVRLRGNREPITCARPKLSIGDVLDQALASLTDRLDEIEPKILRAFGELAEPEAQGPKIPAPGLGAGVFRKVGE